jgi:nitroreductase
MNETLKTIYELNSTHGNFSSRDIMEEELKTIIDACVRASNASARQSYSIIVVDDKSDMKNYLEYVGSRALIFCADFTRLVDTAEYLDHSYQYGGITDFITACTDTALAAQTAVISAKSLGIDYLLTNSVHRRDMNGFYQKFNLPEKLCFPVIALILGYSKNEEQTPRGRLNGAGVVHYGEYNRLQQKELGEIVKLYDEVDRNMGVVFYKRNEEQKYKRYLDWFYKVWSKSNPEYRQRKNAEITNLLKGVGFLE